MKIVTLHIGQGYSTAYDPRLPLPYPFHINAATGDCVHGRGTSDIEPGVSPSRPWRLLGFQADSMIQRLDVTLTEALGNPAGRIVGKLPVFIDGSGTIFALAAVITGVTESERPEPPKATS